MKTRKRYRSAYIVDEAKLRRIHGVMIQEFERLQTPFTFTFETTHAARRTVVVHTLDELLALDNSVKSPIRSLRIECKVEATASTSEIPKTRKKQPLQPSPQPLHEVTSCSVFYVDADVFPSIAVEIESDQTDWGHNLNSLLDEQVERTTQSGFIPRIKSSMFSKIMPLLFFMILMTLAQVAILKGRHFSKLNDNMWLTESDVAELLAKDPPATHENLVVRQLKNIGKKQASDGRALASLSDWRVYAAGSPILLVLICIVYLYFACYPSTVFNWGDMGEHFSGLLARRKLLWTTVVFGTLIGVIANVAVYGMMGLSSQ